MDKAMTAALPAPVMKSFLESMSNINNKGMNTGLLGKDKGRSKQAQFG